MGRYTIAAGHIDNAGTAAASGSITFSGQPTAGNTITITSEVYEFYANGGSYSGANNGVELGSALPQTVENLAQSINANDPLVTAVADQDGEEVDVTAKTRGTGGNSITITNDDSDANVSVDATLAGGLGTDLVLAQLESQGLETGVNDFIMPMDGSVDVIVAALNSLEPMVPVSSTAVSYLLARLGLAGIYFTVGENADGVFLYYQKMDSTDGARATGNSHLRLSLTKGRIVPMTLQASQDQYATLAMNIIALYDGTNQPIVPALNQALTGTAPTRELFTVGPIYVTPAGGSRTLLETTQSMSWDFGQNMIYERGDGHPYASDVVIGTRQTKFQIGSTDIEEMADLGLIGGAIDLAEIFLRKVDLSSSGGRVADATAEHIKLTVNAGRVSVGATQGTGNTSALASTQFNILPINDGTNNVVVISTASAIA